MTVDDAQHSTCTLRIRRRGGRGESGARALERYLCGLAGVEDAAVSFRTGTVGLEFDASITTVDDLRDALQRRGIALADESDADTDERGKWELRRETLFVTLTFIGMVVGFGSQWVDAPDVVLQLGYATAYVFGGWYGLKGAFQTLRHRAVDIDLLMIVAAVGALIIGAPFEGAMLLFLFSLSNVLQHYAIGRSRRAIRSLVEMRPDTAQVLRDGEEVTLPIDSIQVGDQFVVRPGDRIPLDGVVVDGESTIDESSLTGESMPVTKEVGDEVFGGTINETGSLEVEVTRQAHESALSRLIHMVEEAQSERAPTQRLIDRLEQPYVLGVFALTSVAILVPLSLGAEFPPTFYRAMTLMVAASPCAVVISTPAAVLSAIASGGRQGVLFKGGEHVEAAANIDAIAFDKTGTLTQGETQLTDVILREAVGDIQDRDELLALSAAVQSRSEHHLAQATVQAAEERGLEIPTSDRFHAAAGKGVRARVSEATIHIGNRSYVETRLEDRSIDGLESGLEELAALEAEGKTSVFVIRERGEEATLLGWLGFTDTLRPDAAQMIDDLRDLGVEHMVMLTGDNERVARRIAAEVGIDEVHAALLPEEKVDRVAELVDRFETVAMVGDGVNDAPALATASLGIAMGGAGTDVALETADIVLMGDDLSKVPYVLGLGRKTDRTLKVNLGIAFGAIAIMIVAILLRGIPLPLAVIGHEGSTVLVSLNGLRLIGFRG